jgi:hypothetical protein
MNKPNKNPELKRMKRVYKLTVLAAAGVAIVGCGATRQELPPRSPDRPHAEGKPDLVLVWVGQGEAYINRDGSWEPSPSFDYEFSVVQRRFSDHWESLKELHRRHPAYDGSAGPRDQSYFFNLAITPDRGGPVSFKVESSLGPGAGHTDAQFRHAEIELRPDISRFAPFNTYRFHQDYYYERGTLEETVELVDRGEGGDEPWVRNIESATLFAQQKFKSAPTVAR